MITFNVKGLPVVCPHCKKKLEEIHAKPVTAKYETYHLTTRLVSWCPDCKALLPMAPW